MADRFSRKEASFPPPGPTPREDTAAVMKFYKLPKSFPPQVLAEARRIPSKVDASNRLDLRKKFIFTCDPATAKDFDPMKKQVSSEVFG